MVTLIHLSRQTPLELPPTLTTIYLNRYIHLGANSHQHNNEELCLIFVLRKGALPNLKQVGVPAEPIDSDHEPITNVDFVRPWAKNREELKNLRMFKSGKVKLLLLKPGEICESTLKTILLLRYGDDSVVYRQTLLLTGEGLKVREMILRHPFCPALPISSAGDKSKGKACLIARARIAPFSH